MIAAIVLLSAATVYAPITDAFTGQACPRVQAGADPFDISLYDIEEMANVSGGVFHRCLALRVKQRDAKRSVRGKPHKDRSIIR